MEAKHWMWKYSAFSMHISIGTCLNGVFVLDMEAKEENDISNAIQLVGTY